MCVCVHVCVCVCVSALGHKNKCHISQQLLSVTFLYHTFIVIKFCIYLVGNAAVELTEVLQGASSPE